MQLSDLLTIKIDLRKCNFQLLDPIQEDQMFIDCNIINWLDVDIDIEHCILFKL